MQDQVIELLNEARKAEITSAIQYMAHHDEFEFMGLFGLAKILREEAIQEMRHAEWLAERVLYLGGRPANTLLKEVVSEPDVVKNLKADIELEKEALVRLKKGIQLCFEAGDHGSRQLLEKILLDEEKHLEKFEQLLEMVEKLGPQIYLVFGKEE